MQSVKDTGMNIGHHNTFLSKRCKLMYTVIDKYHTLPEFYSSPYLISWSQTVTVTERKTLHLHRVHCNKWVSLTIIKTPAAEGGQRLKRKLAFIEQLLSQSSCDTIDLLKEKQSSVYTWIHLITYQISLIAHLYNLPSQLHLIFKDY